MTAFLQLRETPMTLFSYSHRAHLIKAQQHKQVDSLSNTVSNRLEIYVNSAKAKMVHFHMYHL